MMTLPDTTIAAIMGEVFAHVLRDDYLTDWEWAEMLERNRLERSPLVCHSHDHCDANMAMLEAFEAVMGREPVYPSDVDDDDGQRRSDADFALMGMAWDYAKPLRLTGED